MVDEQSLRNKIDVSEPSGMKLVEEIERLKTKKNALILAHNYQRAEVQDVADFVGDSLELARRAAEADADVIVFCGVDFMAETAAVLNPDKKVLIPDAGATCPMAQMLTAAELRRVRAEHPDAAVVLYINTLAESKAEADCVCTSANAAAVVNAMDAETVIFGPDANLAYYVRRRSPKELVVVPERGLCPTHHQIALEDVLAARRQHPGAKLVAHPECVPEVQDAADHIASTSGMVRFCREDAAAEYLIATEIGLLHRLRRETPQKRFHAVSETAVCPQMKMHTLPKILRALERERPTVTVPKETADAAREAIQRMLELE